MIAQILDSIVAILWGPPLQVTLIGAGVYLCVISKFWHIRHFTDAFRYCFFPKNTKEESDSSKILPYQAASVAIAGSIGSGNIGGVASAVALGGPGAIFWMWITAMVGMMTKMVEVTLAVYYRDAESDGRYVGGPLFYIEKGIRPKCKLWWILAILFGSGIFLQLILAPESFTVGESLQELTGIRALYCSAFFSAMCWIVILGGLKRVVKFAALMMPLMSALYILFGLYVIVLNVSQLPSAIALIVTSAFTPAAAVGGFAGSTIMLTARTGIARGLFSNEAGWGTSPMIHAAADNKHPVEQGMWGIMEVFIDTMIICTITGLVIVVTGEWSSDQAGATLTSRSFAHGIGRFSPYFISISLFLFCWTTVTGWFSYYQGIVEYVFKNHSKIKRYMIKFLELSTPLYGFLIALMIDVWNVDLAYAWLVVDISSALPTFFNLIAVVWLSKKFLAIVRDYEGPKKLWGAKEYDKIEV